MFVVDDELKAFIESGVATLVGAATRAGRPEHTYAWGARVCASRKAVEVFLEQARAERVLEAIRETGWVAMTQASPVSYRSLQLKGRVQAVGPADEADAQWVQRHREAFTTETALIGDPPTVIRNLYMENEPLVRVEFTIERAFDQTPGPGAGQPL